MQADQSPLAVATSTVAAEVEPTRKVSGEKSCCHLLPLLWCDHADHILLGTGNVPELKTTPLEAGFLLAAECLTACSLMLGGLGVLAAKSWGSPVELAALGMLMYCTVYSVGVFGQAGNLPATGFFVVITSLSAVFAIDLIVTFKEGRLR
jgi:hypothetical protein